MSSIPPLSGEGGPSNTDQMTIGAGGESLPSKPGGRKGSVGESRSKLILGVALVVGVALAAVGLAVLWRDGEVGGGSGGSASLRGSSAAQSDISQGGQTGSAAVEGESENFAQRLRTLLVGEFGVDSFVTTNATGGSVTIPPWTYVDVQCWAEVPAGVATSVPRWYKVVTPEYQGYASSDTFWWDGSTQANLIDQDNHDWDSRIPHC